ncbi:nucleoside phosphatase family-domain-containing protein, partial [Blyttiomyces helicus]
GVYAWITVNYLLKRIGQPTRQPSAAIMDLGGGSTQIVFEPQLDTPMAAGDHRYALNFGGLEYVLYQHSYDGYGLNAGRKRLESAGSAATCAVDAAPSTGTAFDRCHELVRTSLFDKTQCATSQCSFDGVYQPRLADTFTAGDIYAFSYFFDNYAEPFGGFRDSFTVGDIRSAALRVCAGRVVRAELRGPDADKLLADPKWCGDLGFIYGLLSDGYELPDVRELRTAKKIAGIETGWSLGASIFLLDALFGKGGMKGVCKA